MRQNFKKNLINLSILINKIIEGEIEIELKKSGKV